MSPWMTNTCMDTPCEPLTALTPCHNFFFFRLVHTDLHKDHERAQMSTWMRYQQAYAKVLATKRIVPLRWLLGTSVCSSLWYWIMELHRCSALPLQKVMSIVPPTEARTPAIFRDPATVANCNLSILTRRHRTHVCIRNIYLSVLLIETRKCGSG